MKLKNINRILSDYNRSAEIVYLTDCISWSGINRIEGIIEGLYITHAISDYDYEVCTDELTEVKDYYAKLISCYKYKED